jgi:hypothetical protein
MRGQCGLRHHLRKRGIDVTRLEWRCDGEASVVHTGSCMDLNMLDNRRCGHGSRALDFASRVQRIMVDSNITSLETSSAARNRSFVAGAIACKERKISESGRVRLPEMLLLGSNEFMS